MELDRIRRRFTELPIAQAEEGMRHARPLLDRLSRRLGGQPVPDLGPAPIPDQLAVLVFDAYAKGRGEGIDTELAGLRRDLP